MVGRQPGGGGRRRRPAHILKTQFLAADLVQHPENVRLHEGPSPLVFGLFLAPDEFGVLESGELRSRGQVGKRIILLEAHDVDVVDPALLALLEQIIVHLPGGQHYALDLLVGDKLDFRSAQLRIVPQHSVETGARQEFADVGYCELVPQQ